MPLEAATPYILRGGQLYRRPMTPGPPPPPPGTGQSTTTLNRAGQTWAEGWANGAGPDLANVGLTNESLLESVYPTGTSGIGVPTFTPTASLYENKIFWAQVNITNTGPEFRNCLFAGPDPNTLLQFGGSVTSFDSSTVTRPHFNLFDCLVSMKPWTIPTYPGRPLAANVARTISPSSCGLHGGGYSAYGCLIEDVSDGTNYTQGRADSFCVQRGCITRRGYYVNNWYGPSDGQPHCDAFQFNRGKNIDLQYNRFGGVRNPVGYTTIGTPGWGQGYNAGDDYWNAGFMIKQEVGSTAYDLIENVTIAFNRIDGGVAGINMFYVASRLNTFGTMSITDNKFGYRDPSWGGYGYIIKSPQITSTIARNTIYETGAPVPIANGGSG